MGGGGRVTYSLFRWSHQFPAAGEGLFPASSYYLGRGHLALSQIWCLGGDSKSPCWIEGGVGGPALEPQGPAQLIVTEKNLFTQHLLQRECHRQLAEGPLALFR